MEKIFLSTVTPVYRGAAYLGDLVAALGSVQQEIRASGLPIELAEAIFVDDAAVDGSPSLLDELQSAHDWVHVIHLSRNFGQHGATVAGILHSSGDWVATLDEDLQHDPQHLLPLLMDAAATSNDVVYAAPETSVHASAFRNISSQFFKAGMSWLVGNPTVRRFNSFRMLRGTVARAACSVSTHDTYFDVVLNWFTNRVATLKLPIVDRRSVTGSPSGYNLKRLLGHARRMFISSEIRPLRIAALIGFIALLVSAVIGAVTMALRLAFPETVDARGWASLMLAISFFGGLNAFILGVALEYVSTLVLHTLGKPTFFVVDRSKDLLLQPYISKR